MERRISLNLAACLRENWVYLCTGKDLQKGVKNRRNQSFFFCLSWRKKRKRPFCCWIYSARLLLSIRSCKFMAVGTKRVFFLPFPCYREVRLVSELWSLKESALNLNFTRERRLKFYTAELYNLHPSFELAWLLSFGWE